MATPIGSLEREGDVSLLRCLDPEIEALAVGVFARSAVRVDGELSVDKRPVLSEQIRHAVLLLADFLVGRERDDQVALRYELLLLQPNERGGNRRILVLHVARAAPVEVAVLLGEAERWQRPVLGFRLDDVEMAVPQNGARLAAPLETHDDVHLIGILLFRQNAYLRIAEAAGLEVAHQ